MIFTILDNPTIDGVILFVTLAIALIMSLTLHEFAHAFIALKSGDRTAQVNGRVTLNPLKHLDPMGTIMMLTIGFGYAKPVPVNPNNFRNYKKGMFAVSIAGVTINFALAILSSFLTVMLFVIGAPALLVDFFFYLMLYNFMLAFFNLIPIFPLDGFRLLETFLKERNKFVQFMRKYGAMIFIFLIVISVIVRFGLDRGAPAWIRFFDLIGLYMDYTARLLANGLIRLWALIFDIPVN